MENVLFINLVRRWWWALALGALVAGICGFAYSQIAAPTYQAITKVLVGPINTDLDTLQASGELSRTYADLAISRPILAAAIAETGVNTTVQEVLDEESVTATSNQVTRIVEIDAQAGDARLAARFANSIAKQVLRLSDRGSEQQTEALTEFERTEEVAALSPKTEEEVLTAARRVLGRSVAGSVAVVDPAAPPPEAVSPKPSLTTGLAGLAGLLAVAILALVKESVARRGVEGERELVGLDRTPFLGAVDAARSRDPAQALPVERGPDSLAAERYRSLAAKAGLLDGRKPVRSLLVLDAGDGTSGGAVAANLAAVLAEADRRVLLVDAGDGRAGASSLLGLDRSPGLGDLALETGQGEFNGQLDRLLVQRAEDLNVLPRGAAGRPRLLDVDRAQKMLDQLLEGTGMVIISAPPLDRSTSALTWARITEGTVLVVDEGRTSHEDLDEMLASLSLIGANVLGTVLGRAAGIRLRGLPLARGTRADAAQG